MDYKGNIKRCSMQNPESCGIWSLQPNSQEKNLKSGSPGELRILLRYGSLHCALIYVTPMIHCIDTVFSGLRFIPGNQIYKCVLHIPILLTMGF